MHEISIEQASKDAYALSIKIRCALNENGWDNLIKIVNFANPEYTQKRAEWFLDFLLEDAANTSYDMRHACLSHAVDYTIGVINRLSGMGLRSGVAKGKGEVALYKKSFNPSSIIENANKMIDQHIQLQNHAMNKHIPSKKNKL